MQQKRWRSESGCVFIHKEQYHTSAFVFTVAVRYVRIIMVTACVG